MDTVGNQQLVRAAAAQLSPVLDKPGGTLTKVLGCVDDAAAKGVDIIAFPETFRRITRIFRSLNRRSVLARNIWRCMNRQ